MGRSQRSRGRVELHIHLDGAVRLTTIWDLSKQKKLPLPGDGSFEALQDVVIVNKPGDLAGFLQAFKYIVPPLKGDVVAVERIAYELCEDEARKGVIYFEGRYSPHTLSTDEVPPAKIVEAVNRGFRRGEKDFKIKARSILCCIVGKPEWCKPVVDLCTEYAKDGVVAIDIAGDESLYGKGTDVKIPQEYIDAYLEAERRGIHRTMHAGEVGSWVVVDKALNELHSERIGHGYHVLDNEKLYLETMAKGIHFEMCPKSSWCTGAVTETTLVHPIVRFANDFANYSINSDDPAITNTLISDEINIVQRWGFDETHIARAAFNAARSSFLPEDEKKELIKKLKIQYGVPDI